MICKRCGTGGFSREGGYCLHCQLAIDIETSIGTTLEKAGVDEGFPDWQKPTKKDLKDEKQRRLL